MYTVVVCVATLALFAQGGQTKPHGYHLEGETHSEVSWSGHHEEPKYFGPLAVPKVDKDGHLEPTLEVAEAAYAHHVAYEKAAAEAAKDGGHDDGSYHEEGHAVAEHGSFSGEGHIELAEAGHEVSAGYELGKFSGEIHGEHYHGHHELHHEDHYEEPHKEHHEEHHFGNEITHHEPAVWHGPIATPKVLPSGHLADTHEVAAAKNEHLLAHAHAYEAHAGWEHHGHGHHEGHHKEHHEEHHAEHHAEHHEEHHAEHHELHHELHHQLHHDEHHFGNEITHHEEPKVWHGPIATPKVLPSGHLADTHEVAAAKNEHLLAHAHAHKAHSAWEHYGHGHH